MSLEEATKRITLQKQSLDEAYDPPTNFLEIEVTNPITHEVNNRRFTDYEIRFRTNLPIFRIKEFTCRRRYSDFEWLRSEIKRTVAIILPELPGKAIIKQLFLSQDDGIFEDDFIEERRKGLEEFINSLAGHPLVQNEKSLHHFLLQEKLDKESFVPGKVSR